MTATPRNLRRRRAVRLTLRGWAILLAGLALLVAAYVAERRELLVVGVAAVLLVLAGLLFVRIRRPRLEVERTFEPAIAVAGDAVDVTLRLRNVASSPSPALEWNDVVPWPEEIPPATLRPIGIGGNERRRREVGYRAHPTRRGHYAIGPLVVEYGDPFGVVKVVVALGAPERLVVVPDLVDLPAGGPSLSEGEGVAQLVQRRAIGNEDDLSTREYRRGDALRRVHWRASARHGELMVRQEEQRSNPDARIVLDTRLGGYPDAEEDAGAHWVATAESDPFEWAVRMVASLALHLDAEGFTVRVEESGPPQLEQLGGRWEGRRRAEDFLTSLAGVHLVDVPDDHVGGTVSDARGPVFAVVSDAEPHTVDWLLRRRDPRDIGVAFLVSTAPERLSELGGPARRLRDAGWSVLTIGPDDSPADAWVTVGRERELVDDD